MPVKPVLRRTPRFQPGPTTPVAFLVTQEEYERLKAESIPAGARSLPEFVRAKVLRGITGSSLVRVASQLDELEQAVRQLSRALENTGASDGC